MNIKTLLAILTLLLPIISLGQRQTDYNESTFKAELLTKDFDNVEGIYEETSTLTRYGIIKAEYADIYLVIYLNSSSSHIRQYWKIGTIKGYVYKTATEGLLKAAWYLFPFDYDKQDFYMEFSSVGIKEYKNWEGAENSFYIKMFPSANEIKINKTQPASGTGFAISTNGIIVTNFHVISGAKTINVRGVNSDFTKTFKAKALVSDKNNDLALIQIEEYYFTSLGTIPFTIKAGLAGVGEKIFVLGYPLRGTMGDEIKLTDGIISSRTGFQGDITSYQISAPVQPGNSGGPLFDSQGNLIGIINAKHIGAENASYAVKASYLSNLIENLPSSPKLQTTNSLAGKTMTKQVELVKKFVYIIETE